MKIILINAFSARLGGGQTYVKNLLSRLPTDDCLIYIFAPDDLLIPNDGRIKRLRTGFPVTNPIIRLFWERIVLPLILKQLRVDILFCPGGMVNTKVPSECVVVTMFRNMLPFDNRALNSTNSLLLKIKNRLLKLSMLSSMRKADLVIFISEYARSGVESHQPIKKGLTIPHGVSENFLVGNDDLKRPVLPFSGGYILYVSRFEFYKRHLELINAYALLPVSIRETQKLLIVGGHDTLSGMNVKKRIVELGIENQVVLLGEYPYLDLPAVYKHASLFVFASVCENCPNILLEAMGAGVPILCSDYQPMPEFGGESVRYVSPDDPKIMRDEIAELLSNSELIAQMRGKVACRAKLYSWDQAARKTWEALLSLKVE
jgi:glycosyltransferase involved in cell wall biosynthesis